MFRLIYSSKLATPMTATLLSEIVSVSVNTNQKIGITGILLFAENAFMQVLEGSEEHVRATMETIDSDSRHSDVRILFSGGATERAFPDWHMKAAAPTAEQIAGIRALGTAQAIFDPIPQPYSPEIDFYIRMFFDNLASKAA